MKKSRIMLAILTVFCMGFSTLALFSNRVYAAENEDCTTILDTSPGSKSCDDVNGGTIVGLLRTVLNVFSTGVLLVGTIGIIVAGAQYMTARDNSAQAEAAKRRLINVVIGLIVYGIFWLAVGLLVPSGVKDMQDAAENGAYLDQSTLILGELE